MEEALNLGKKKTGETVVTVETVVTGQIVVNAATGERAKQGIMNRAMEEGEEDPKS